MIALSLALPGIGLPQTLYNNAVQSLINLNQNVQCGSSYGNSCHFPKLCKEILASVKGKNIEIQFSD